MLSHPASRSSCPVRLRRKRLSEAGQIPLKAGDVGATYPSLPELADILKHVDGACTWRIHVHAGSWHAREAACTVGEPTYAVRWCGRWGTHGRCGARGRCGACGRCGGLLPGVAFCGTVAWTLGEPLYMQVHGMHRRLHVQ